MRRHNSRLFRVARAILRDDAEAEDALQDAYLDAYRHIADFRGGAQLVDLAHAHRHQPRADASAPADGATRVVVLVRRGTGRRSPGVEPDQTEADVADEDSRIAVRGRAAQGVEIRRLLERRIDDLPVAFRVVFVMRDVEDMSVRETAECLAVPAATVRTRLFRARALLREALARDLGLGHDGRVRLRRGALHRGRGPGPLRNHEPGLNLPRPQNGAAGSLGTRRP